MHNNNPLKFKSLKNCQNAFSSPIYYCGLIWVGLLENSGISNSLKREDGTSVPTLWNIGFMKYTKLSKDCPSHWTCKAGFHLGGHIQQACSKLSGEDRTFILPMRRAVSKYVPSVEERNFEWKEHLKWLPSTSTSLHATDFYCFSCSGIPNCLSLSYLLHFVL